MGRNHDSLKKKEVAHHWWVKKKEVDGAQKKTKRRRRRPCISITLIRVCTYHMDRLTHTQLTARYTVIWTQDMKKISKECKTKGGHIPRKGEWKGRKNKENVRLSARNNMRESTTERRREAEGEGYRQRGKDKDQTWSTKVWGWIKITHNPTHNAKLNVSSDMHTHTHKANNRHGTHTLIKMRECNMNHSNHTTHNAGRWKQ